MKRKPKVTPESDDLWRLSFLAVLQDIQRLAVLSHPHPTDR